MTSIAGGHNNVVQLPFAGGQQRRFSVVDEQLAVYLKNLNASMLEKAGVSYISVRNEIHGGDLDAVRTFLDNGVDAPKAVSQIMQDHGFISIGAKTSREMAAAYNKVQAAISEFVAESPDWHRTDDGRVYSVMNDTVAFLRPVRFLKESPNDPESCGFGIELREGAEIDHSEGTVLDDGTRGERFAGWDLSGPLEAMHEYVAAQEQTREFTF
jgi:hypothetical protein